MENGKKIAEARKAKGLSQHKLSAALKDVLGIKISAQGIQKIESLATGKSKYENEIMQYLGISDAGRTEHGTNMATELFVSENDQMPVYASEQNDDGTITISANFIEHISRPTILVEIPEAFAVLVSGETMSPAYEPGDRVFINPRLPVLKDSDVIVYSSKTPGGGIAQIRRLISFNSSQFTVKSWNPPLIEVLDRKNWPVCCRIVGKFNK